jgi:cyanate permease
MRTFLGPILRALHAEPTADGNLTAGMLVVIPAIALGGIVLLAGARHLPGEMSLMVAKLRAKAPAADPLA